LEVARILSSGPDLKHEVFFMTFTGEETFFRGSRYYLANPLIPLDQTLLVINLDMVGRLRNSPLQISGLGTLPHSWMTQARAYLEPREQPTELSAAVQGGSDHRRFDDAGIPVLYLTTGNHRDHHQMSDTPEKIDFEGVDEVATVVAGIIRALTGGGL
jgi:Zn-dependent M28 family amino/carboxypeptidase